MPIGLVMIKTQKITSNGENAEKSESLGTDVGGGGVWISAATAETVGQFLKELNTEFLWLLQPLHSWVYTPTNWKQGLRQIFVHPSSYEYSTR